MLLRAAASATALMVIMWNAPTPHPAVNAAAAGTTPDHTWIAMPEAWVDSCQHYSFHWLLYSLYEPLMMRVRTAGTEARRALPHKGTKWDECVGCGMHAWTSARTGASTWTWRLASTVLPACMPTNEWLHAMLTFGDNVHMPGISP